MSALRDRTARTLAGGSAAPNMTPMVDIVLVILIFFMASTTLIGPEWFLRAAVEADAADEGAAPDPFSLPEPRDRIVLHAPRDGLGATTAVSEDDPAVTHATGLGLIDVPLERVLAQLAWLVEGGDASLLRIEVRPEPEASYDAVVRVHEACYALGIERVSLVR